MIYLLRPSTVVREDSNRLIKRARNKLLSSRGEIDVKAIESYLYRIKDLHSGNVVFVDHFGLVQLPHVKSVDVGILISTDEINRLLRVPAQRRCFIFQLEPLNRGFSSDIIQYYAPIRRGAQDHVYFRGVVLNFSDRVGSPVVEDVDRLRAIILPNLDD
jgi:hypothetical protein